MSYIVAEYECPEHGRFDSLVIRADDGYPPNSDACSTCGVAAPFVMSAPLGRVKRGEVHRGKSDERPPHALNTEALADGMPMHEWTEREQAKERDMRRAQRKANT